MQDRIAAVFPQAKPLRGSEAEPGQVWSTAGSRKETKVRAQVLYWRVLGKRGRQGCLARVGAAANGSQEDAGDWLLRLGEGKGLMLVCCARGAYLEGDPRYGIAWYGISQAAN